MARHGDAIRTVTVHRIVWVHRDWRCQNILVRNGRLSEIINWENSGWFLYHWQLHAMRNVRVAYPKRICAMWEDAEFPPETEAEFQASKTLPYYQFTIQHSSRNSRIQLPGRHDAEFDQLPQCRYGAPTRYPLLTTLVFSKVACPGLLGERRYVENLSVSGPIDIASISDSQSSPLQAANQITVLWSFLEDDSTLISLLLHRETIE